MVTQLCTAAFTSISPSSIQHKLGLVLVPQQDPAPCYPRPEPTSHATTPQPAAPASTAAACIAAHPVQLTAVLTLADKARLPRKHGTSAVHAAGLRQARAKTAMLQQLARALLPCPCNADMMASGQWPQRLADQQHSLVRMNHTSGYMRSLHTPLASAALPAQTQT